MGIEYSGTKYTGWQKQSNTISIQERLENAISYIANEKIQITCAGRTDTGVHAIEQVIHFDTYVYRTYKEWTLGINTKLPEDIVVIWIKKVSSLFNARFSALARCYRYIIYNDIFRSAILKNKVFYFSKFLNVKKMYRASQFLIGEHDFSSFRSIYCQSNTPWRNMMYINVFRKNNYVILDLKANSFVHKMVRNIVGSLIEIGRSKKNETWILNVLNYKKRQLAGFTANPEGLYLYKIYYPNTFNLPKNKRKMLYFNYD